MSARGRRRSLAPLAAATVAAALVLHVRLLRPRQLTWGATPAEVARPLPGDDLVPSPSFAATRAVTVAAPPARVWPWLVQVGVTRGGWYSYDLLDNLGRPSARRIVPELQHLAVGDVVPMSPDGRSGMRVHALDPPTSMVWGTPGESTWVWQLDARPGESTRLLARVRARYRLTPASLAFAALLEAADFWMMRKMLVSLRERVERAAGGG